MKHINNLSVVLMKTINNPNTTNENRDIAREALDAVQETKRELDDERTKEEATNRLWRTFGLREHAPNNEEEVQIT